MQNVPEDLDWTGPPTDVVTPDFSLDPLHALAENLAADMADAWRCGRRVCAEDHLQRYPQLLDCQQAAFRLICEEICLRQEAGLAIERQKFLERFPQWQSELVLLLDCHDLLQPELGRSQASPSGPILDDFHSLAELGRGAQGRVFLARQISLGDRPVVLKVTPRHGREHLSLARLQHTHIAPLYWVHDDPARDQRILCMPFFGTVTLAEVLTALKDKPPGQRSGADLVAVLDQAQAKVHVDLPGQGPYRPQLERESFARVAAWIGSCLADALQYAHDRGLCHLDLKPSNILLARDGQPLLLDFHLAREPISPGRPHLEGVGGTPMYMSPEQRAVVAAICDHKPLTLSVDGRSDIYSLGLILYQLLGGPVPVPVPVPRLESCNRGVSTGLADILHKCIAPEATDRYRTAGALAADFRRHLYDQPLRGVRNRNWKERWDKWNRRDPRALKLRVVTALLFLMVLGAGIFLFLQHRTQQRERLATITQRLRQGVALLKEERYDEAIAALSSGGKLAQDTSGASDMAQQFETRLALAHVKQKAQILHAIADRLRFKASGPDSPSGLAALAADCGKLWESRERILAFFDRQDEALLQQQVRTDLLDVATIWTDLESRLSVTKSASSHRAALDVLAEAEKIFGSNPVLQRERYLHASALGLAEQADAAAAAIKRQPPATAWEHYALGRSYLLVGDLQHAAGHLDQAVALDPGGFWPNFYQGMGAYRRGNYHDAVSAFRAALSISPRAVVYYNRGLAYSRLNDTEHALNDYGQALRLDPNLAEAALNRGILYFQQKDFANAAADLKYALAKGSDPAATHYNLALVFAAEKKGPDALFEAQQALKWQPEHREARELAARLQRKK
jgi:serine/threonine protein kinase/tetratricopeptide (TPR) repeat protein